jgi:hypothetical protein
VTTRVGRRVVVASVLRRVVRVVVRVVVRSVVTVVEVIAGGGAAAGTSGGGTASAAGGGAAVTVSIGVAPVATPTPSTPATAVDTPSVERTRTRGHVRGARGAGGRSAVVGPATVTASSSLVTSDQRHHPSGGHG